MSNVIRVVVEMSINEGQAEEFKQLATELINKVSGNEPGTLDYDWYLTADGNTCNVVEAYQDAAAVMAHLANVGPVLQALMQHCRFTNFNVYGDVTDELQGVADSMGATVTPYWSGAGA